MLEGAVPDGVPEAHGGAARRVAVVVAARKAVQHAVVEHVLAIGGQTKVLIICAQMVSSVLFTNKAMLNCNISRPGMDYRARDRRWREDLSGSLRF